jgi:hypothetical protein
MVALPSGLGMVWGRQRATEKLLARVLQGRYHLPRMHAGFHGYKGRRYAALGVIDNIARIELVSRCCARRP